MRQTMAPDPDCTDYRQIHYDANYLRDSTDESADSCTVLQFDFDTVGTDLSSSSSSSEELKTTHEDGYTNCEPSENLAPQEYREEFEYVSECAVIEALQETHTEPVSVDGDSNINGNDDRTYGYWGDDGNYYVGFWGDDGLFHEGYWDEANTFWEGYWTDSGIWMDTSISNNNTTSEDASSSFQDYSEESGSQLASPQPEQSVSVFVCLYMCSPCFSLLF